ncbi:MAG: GGDEF domain-containing protein [Arcobacteraceae bacterium]|jgi:diguanylate cyclase (GGDEF)-like protein|nr:GGDEF domain-containing protein [Arcobacteraceae bacterium]
MLQSEVNKKTADLQKTTTDLRISNNKQKQLFSVLRTVADCNQILITTSSIEELISKTASSMHLNKAFSGVKIMLEENGELVVKESLGLDEEFDVYPLEQKVFKENKSLFMNSFDEHIPQQCLTKIRKYDIKEVYILPLVKDTFAQEALGVMTVCSTIAEGLSKEEVDMIKELAGDMGFAINSFLQKELIKKLSYYDMLTNLPNKRFLLQQLEKSIHSSAISRQFGAVLHINFDDFKSVNNIKGLSAGDKILQEMSKRLLDTIHRNEMIFRIGGDEFIVLLENIGTYSNNALIESQKVALEILGTVKEPFVVDEQNFYMTLGIGVVLFKEYTHSVEELLNNVESAMHIAKKSGKNSISFYDSKLQEVAISRSMMMQNLKDALVKNEFFVLYQKQVNSKQEIVGAEVLVRWQHPTLGIVSPATFIPIAEESGFILELGEWIFIQSIKELSKWQSDDVRKNWRMSINISPLQFKNSSFVSNLVNIVKEHNVSSNKIRLELTEGILVDDALGVLSKINELKEFGFSISIDDFGTGYSSLAYLKNLPIDELKIDQSFVENIHISDVDQTIVKTIISMGEAFGLDILAEGVETKEQFGILKLLGCKYFQGFLFSKPKSSLELV